MLLNECTRTRWGHTITFRPYLLNQITGDGQQWIKFCPMNYRPCFYIVRIDSQISEHDDDFFQDLESLIETIGGEVGHCCDDYKTNDCQCNGFKVWPRFTKHTGAGWRWNRLDDSELRELML